VVVFSIDDLYKTKAERLPLRSLGYRYRGAPGTHDVGLGLQVIRELRRSRADSAVALPVFDKAIDDRRPEPRIVRGKVGIVLFEGWIVGANTKVDPEQVEPGFKREVARAFREYGLLNAELDDLIVRQLRDLDAIKAMYRNQVRRQRAMVEREGGQWQGLEEEQIDGFVEYFYVDSWDWFHTSPEPLFEDTSLLVVTDDQRRIIDMRLGGRVALHSRTRADVLQPDAESQAALARASQAPARHPPRCRRCRAVPIGASSGPSR
jgi:pantothenate kinase-related protein Tda10